jgi:hypothetical protein
MRERLDRCRASWLPVRQAVASTVGSEACIAAHDYRPILVRFGETSLQA